MILQIGPAFAIGIIAHALKSLVQVRRANPEMTLQQFLWLNRFDLAASLAASAGSLMVLNEFGQLTVASAFLSGYAANSLVESLSTKVSKRVA